MTRWRLGRSLPAAASCAALALVTGCLKVENTLSLRRDGGGTLELTYSIADQTVNRIRSMRRLQARLETAAERAPAVEDETTRLLYLFLLPDETRWRQELDGWAKQGVRVEKLAFDLRNAWHHIEVKLAFDRLESLAALDAFRVLGFSLGKDSKGDYVLFRMMPKSETKPEFDPRDETVRKDLAPFLGGFRVALKVETPGRILETNAGSKSDKAAMWVYDFDLNPTALHDLQSHRLVARFEGRGLNLPEIKWTPPGG